MKIEIQQPTKITTTHRSEKRKTIMKIIRYFKIVKLTLSISIIFSSTSGIAALVKVPAPTKVEEIVVETKYSPELGTTNTVEAGENMFSSFMISASQTFTVKLLDDASGSRHGLEVQLYKGQTSPLFRTYDGYNAFCYPYTYFFKEHTGCIVDREVNGVFDGSRVSVLEGDDTLTNKTKYQVIPNKVELQYINPSFKREILYQGVSKGTIKISFREFIDDMARPAFAQELLYDLESDGTTIIAFKGLRIEVIRATSSEIIYKPLKSFSENSYLK